MPTKYIIELSGLAERVYKRMSEDAYACVEAGDETNSKVTQFRMVEEALDKIIPHDPFSRDRALVGPLSGIFRVKKGRIRICYIGSSSKSRIIVLYVSDTPRKDGDVNDPYKILTKLVKAGKFDPLFDKIRLPIKLKEHRIPPERSIQ
jgi:mRNA-degrading endonuclease RelE of RelBE toxin-antitoxin system